MKVYSLQANLNTYQNLNPIGSGIYDLYKRFNGKPLSPPLETLPVEVVEEGKTLPVSDFPRLSSHIPVFSQRSLDVLGTLLAPAGEMIPLSCENCEDAYVALNVTCLVDALDANRASVKRYTSSERIMRILKYAFLKQRLAGVDIFKIPETALKDVYVTEAFVKRVSGRSLRGFVFKLIWTDEAPLILCPYCLGIIEEETARCPTCGLDTRNDAAFEMTLEEATEMNKVQCQFCGTRIRALADPCPYCKQGKRRQGVREDITIVV